MGDSDSSSSSFSPCPSSQADEGHSTLQKAVFRQPDYVKGEESPDTYRPGGYRRVVPGECIKEGRYEIIRKLGYGEFSTVWLIRDHHTEEYLALKIFKSDPGYWNAAKQEWLASRLVQEQAAKTNHPAARHLLCVRDFFEIDGSVYSSEVHPCIVSELYGEHLYSLNKRIRRVGLALPIVRKIARQLLVALDFIHNDCNLVHTDIKPENCLVRLLDQAELLKVNLSVSPSASPPEGGNVVPSQPLKSPLPAGVSASAAVEIERERSKDSSSTSLSPSQSPLSSLTVSSPGSSAPSFISKSAASLEELVEGRHDSITQNLDQLCMQDREEIEVVLADLGSAVQDTPLKKSSRAGTREYRAPELFLGSTLWSSKVDIWALGCTLFEVATGESLFPKPNYRNRKRPPWPLEAESLMQMLELGGEAKFPKGMLRHSKQASTLLHSDGDILDATLRRTRKDCSLREILTSHFSFGDDDAELFSEFLLRMLRLDPHQRSNATQLLDDPFLIPQ